MKNLVQKLYLFLVYFLLYFPILVLILYSVNNARFSLLWHGFSLRWYVELFQDRGLWSAFMNSVLLGIGASVIATVAGLLACIHLFIHRNQNRRSLFALLLLLVIIPDLVLGVDLLIFLM